MESPHVPSEADLRAADQAGDASAARQLGDLLAQRGEIDGAEEAFRRAADRGDEMAVLSLAYLHEDHRKDPAGAEAAYRRAHELGLVNGSGNLGRLLRERGDLAGAEEAFRRAVERGSLRAVGDLAGVVLQRGNATPDEITALVDQICAAQDDFILNENLHAANALIVGDVIEQECDPHAVERGFRRADDRGSATGAWHVGWALRSKGHFAGAAEAFRRAVERGDARAWSALAGVHLQWGDRAAAEAVAREGDAAGVADASLMLGLLLKEQADTRGASEAFSRADAGGEANGSLNLGLLLMDRGELPEAEAALGRAVERGAEGAEAALGRVRQMVALTADGAEESLWARAVRLELGGDRDGAMSAYLEAFDSGAEPVEHRAMLRYAEILEGRGDPQAETAFERVADSSELDIKAAALRGIASARMQRGETSAALVALLSIVETGDWEESPRALRNLGVIREDMGDISGARAAYESSIELEHPRHSPGAQVNLAQLLDRVGDKTAAERAMREATDSGHPIEAVRAKVLLGFMLQDRGAEDQALELWESVVAAEAGEWQQRAAWNAGVVHFQRRSFDRARSRFQLATGLEDPKETANACYFLGLSAAELGDRAAAREAFQRTAQLATGELRDEALRLLSNGGFA